MNYEYLPPREYDPVLVDLFSDEIARVRVAAGAEINKVRPDFDRGDREFKYHKQGATGEILAFWELKIRKTKFENPELLRGGSQSIPDCFISEDRQPEIKCHYAGSELKVNCESFSKKKAATHYWFVILLPNNRAEHYIIPREEIVNWKRREFEFSEAYYCTIEEVRRKAA